MNDNQKEFIGKVLPGAEAAYQKTGVLPSLTLAQAILESGWGKASIGNNLFGIKANDAWTGKKKLVKTAEYKNGEKYYIDAWFRDYDSIEESVLDHGKLLTNPRYEKVRTAKNYIEACTQLQAAGYATDPNYAKSLINLIETYGLNQWDGGKTNEGIKPAAVNRTLKVGMSGDDIKAIQCKLSELNYQLVADGCFGKTTETAVIAYQKSVGLTPDGIVGEKTREKLGC